MEERKEKIQCFETEDNAILFPANAVSVFGEAGGDQRLGNRGEEDAPPHGSAGKKHGKKPCQDGYAYFGFEFHGLISFLPGGTGADGRNESRFSVPWVPFQYGQE